MTAVLWVTEQGDSALPYYREHIPAKGLAGLGWTVRRAPILVERADHRLVGWKGLPFGYEGMTKIVVCRHLTDPTGTEADSAQMFYSATKAGQLVFYDLDDDLWHLPAHNPALKHYTPEALRVLEENLRWCTGVLTTTPDLAAEIATHTDTPVTLCPNGIDVTDFALHAPHDPLRIGWTGFTQWRAHDLSMIRDQLAAALVDQPVTFVHVGAQAGDGPPIAALLGDWPTPVLTFEWVHFSLYGKVLAEMDLAVVPMEDTPLNRSRSSSTGLALAACGIPFVASPLPAYVELAERLGPGVMLAADDQWEAAVSELLERARRVGWLEYTGAEMRAVVARHYGPKVVAASWAQAFSAELRPPRRAIVRAAAVRH